MGTVEEKPELKIWILEKRLLILNNIISLSYQKFDFHTFLKSILDCVLNNLNFEAGGIYLYNEELKLLELQVYSGLSPEFLSKIKLTNPFQNPYSQIFLEKKSLYIEDYKNKFSHGTDTELNAVVSIPIEDEKGVIGCINIGSKQNAFFTEQEKIILTIIGKEIGNILSRKFYQERLEQSEKKMNEINKRLENEITEKQNDKKLILESKIMAEEANRAKLKFYSNMSHDLRTPMNSIIGFSEIIRDGNVGSINKEQSELIDIILNSSHHLLSLIDELLNVSKK